MNLINIVVLFVKRTQIDSFFTTLSIASSSIFVFLAIANSMLGLMCKPRRLPVAGISCALLALVASGGLFALGLVEDIQKIEHDDFASDEMAENEGGVIFEIVAFVLNVIYSVIVIAICARIKRGPKAQADVSLEEGGRKRDDDDDEYLQSSRDTSFDYSNRNSSIDYTRGSSRDLQRDESMGGSAIIANDDNDTGNV